MGSLLLNSKNNVLVFGFYSKNLGDNLFKPAFQKLFPQFNFYFTNYITKQQLEIVDTVFIGGGSFLIDDPQIDPETLQILKSKKILYIGIGPETNISTVHQELLKLAKIVVIRNEEHLNKIKELNLNVHFLPDLVYFLHEKVNQRRVPNSVLILPNVSVLPNWKSPNWKHVSWNYFKSEFGQIIDEFEANRILLNFFPMSLDDKLNDIDAATEMINVSSDRKQNAIERSEFNNNPLDILNFFTQFEIIITQRYHGMILAEMANVPYVCIHHHDKLKSSYFSGGEFVPYYGFSKHLLYSKINDAKLKKRNIILPIDQDIYRNIISEIEDIVLGEN